jgi:LL-diaminopimelate aminotransferase
MSYFARRGWTVEASEASFYLWMKVPAEAGGAATSSEGSAARGDDVAFVDQLLRAGIVAVPGSALGDGGEGYVRWALVPTPEDCREAIARLDQVRA